MRNVQEFNYTPTLKSPVTSLVTSGVLLSGYSLPVLTQYNCLSKKNRIDKIIGIVVSILNRQQETKDKIVDSCPNDTRVR